MTKLEAWKAWSAQSGASGDLFTLEKSSHGKAFSFAWDAAERESAECMCGILLSIIDKQLAYKETGFAELAHGIRNKK
ncbi:hypothetical protein UFOVP274_51 [uncultured Caudovirales phage]|uniref:Uncharacterized protein n=1 Tax=uncultured Caudovirales phage TaxID=2100421 RepID=A0A6J5LMC9_9CAUD|nr:hypothetical protein UFOVP274_51 [uncultured Caudovirales phage]